MLPRGYLLLTVFLVAELAASSPQPTFYRDVVPVLQEHCQECHRAGEIGPMPLLSYNEVRPWAKSIRDEVLRHQMPPWFADPRYGHFANDRTLKQGEIDTLCAWVSAGSPMGRAKDAPPRRVWPRDWQIGKPDAVWQMPEAFLVPSSHEIDYQYFIVPTGLKEDRWVTKVEVRPGNRSVVHHAVVYIREPGSTWLQGMPGGKVFTVPITSPDAFTTNDILFTYTPGSGHDEWPSGMAKLIPAGSDLVFQMHYQPGKSDVKDQSRIGVVFAKEKPAERVLTLQLTQDRLFIPPGDPDYRVSVRGTLPDQARLLSVFPHMHLRGKSFEFAAYENGQRKILLKVNDYNFYWQLTYRFAEPMHLKAGTPLECVAVFDNSRNNPLNPDPDVMVRYGAQSTDEMMIGFFDIAVDASLDKQRYFERRKAQTRKIN